ncbi:hypothetical protein [uncultured Pseudodesulfovibrio sp.]|uniref:hypothetical protein n=1 Tax=uncultured Pseudodesulfovibrio sp. TaxID=2035858 RepID=UPI0029C6D109|nr:hypothetical protein [uncultured Pseudodesulfovibrio sp.]
MAELTLQNSSEYALAADGRDMRTVIGGSDERWPGLVVPNANLSLKIGGQEVAWLNINRTDATAVPGETFDGTTLSVPTGDIFRMAADRLKWDVEFTTHPGVYAWGFALRDSGNLSYHYQPDLTDQELAAGVERPEDVVGSYAIYMDRMHNEYGTGKFAHVYRPLFQDANGDEQWGSIEIADGVMTISIAPEWLDGAAFPVTLDPTIGYDTMGSSNIAGSQAYRAALAADKYTAASGDTITAIHMGLRTYGSGSINVGVFDLDDSLSRITEATLTASDSSYTWRHATGLSASLVAGDEYVMGFSSSADLRPIMDSYTSAAIIGTYGDPFTDSGGASYRFSVYADVESGGATPDVTAAISGELWDISGAVTAQASNPVSASISGQLEAIIGSVAMFSSEDSTAAMDGGLDDILGAVVVEVDNISSAALSGHLGDISGGVVVDVRNQVVAFISGQIGDLTGAVAVTIYPDGITEISSSSAISFDRTISDAIAFDRTLASTITFELGG